MTADAGMLLITLVGGVPLGGVLAGLIGWWALRDVPAHWPGVMVAFAVLLSPYLLSMWIAGASGFEAAMIWGAKTVVSPLVFVGLLAGAYRQFIARR